MGHRKRQEKPQLLHHAFFIEGPYRQADSWNKSKEWFLKGLERFANADDSMKGYQAVGKAFPSFWPLPLEDSSGKDLSWHADAHRLFLFYRDSLRGLWTRNPATIKQGIQIPLLFGIVERSYIEGLLSGETLSRVALDAALSPLRNSHPGLRLPSLSPLACFWPDWAAGNIEYVSLLNFQRSLWLLFCESWRAKVCPRCSMYFLAQKPPQLYCSLNCSSAVHRASSLKWWKQKGSQKRMARSKEKPREA